MEISEELLRVFSLPFLEDEIVAKAYGPLADRAARFFRIVVQKHLFEAMHASDEMIARRKDNVCDIFHANETFWGTRLVRRKLSYKSGSID